MKILIIALVALVVAGAVFLLYRSRSGGTADLGPKAVADEMTQQADRAVQTARERFQIQLDYSEGSVEKVEQVLAHLESEKLNEDEKSRMALQFGGYIGQVMRRHFGGEWQANDVSGFPAVALVRDKDNMIFPAAKVFKRLTNGEEDNVWSFYEIVTDQLRPPDQRRFKVLDLNEELKRAENEKKK